MKMAKSQGGTYLTIVPINVFTSVTPPAPDASFIPEERTDDIENNLVKETKVYYCIH